jgi:hypothetical protein
MPSIAKQSRAEQNKAEQGESARARPEPNDYYPDGDGHDSLDHYNALTGSRPWGQASGKWLSQLETDYGIAAVIAAMDRAWATDPDRKTVLGRIEADLSRKVYTEKKMAPPPSRKKKPESEPDPEAAAEAARLRALWASSLPSREEARAIIDKLPRGREVGDVRRGVAVHAAEDVPET